MVQLRDITKDNYEDVLALCVNDSQKSFVSTTAESLSQALEYSNTAYPFAVYGGGRVVGFIMMGYYEAKGYYTLWKLLIDKEHQGKGYGRAALELGIEFLKNHFDVSEIYTGVSPGNSVAKSLYESVGFRFTGLEEDNMEEMVLTLK